MLRNIIGFIVGYVAGSAVNFALIMVNMAALMPAGTDFTTPDGINAAMANLQPLNFAVVFLAHALGTFVGVVVAMLIAVSQKYKIALCVGALFLSGGIYAALVIGAPLWFEAADILLAYIPMAYLGWKIAGDKR